MKKYALVPVLALLLILTSLAPVAAEEEMPVLPAPLQTLVDQGVQFRYLGNHGSLDGYMTVKNGQEQYFYVTEDRKSMLMGILFDDSGRVITLEQVKKLQDENDDILGFLEEKDAPATDKSQPQMSEFKTPAEQLYDDVSQANWVALGRPDAPVIYSFMDPQCPHCHAFSNDLRKGGFIQDGRVQVRVIPIGVKKETLAQAAFLLAAPNPQDRWFRHLDGDEKALPVSSGVNTQGVERNLAIMQSWKFDVTPLTIYRSVDGEVKIVQGRAKNIGNIINDLSKTASQK